MKKKLIIAFCLTVFLVTGCSVPFHKKLDNYLKYGLYDAALATIEDENKENKQGIYKDKNKLLYYFDKGSVTQMLGKYTDLNVILDKAPARDKVARAKAALPFMEAGRVSTLENAAWQDEYYTQLKVFAPKAKYADMVDVTTMTINNREIPGQEIFDMAVT